MNWTSSIAGSLLALAMALGSLVAVGNGGPSLFELPMPVSLGLVAIAMQWLAFVPALAWKTEHFYDLWGAFTYLTVVTLALSFAPAVGTRSMVVGILVAVWALRLGSFLFLRVRSRGSDARFDHIKVSGPRFFLAWSLQGAWVCMTLLGALAVFAKSSELPLTLTHALGLALWFMGFVVEVVADEQKRRFRAAGATGFIHSGLWAWSRHPNYFGEILIWIGVAVFASPELAGWSWAALASPLFVFVLLRFGSGIPILEARADARFGHLPHYQEYVRRTALLVPRPPR